MRTHNLIQHIQARVELDLRVWRYLLPPNDELQGHEIMGSFPVWQPIEPTDHFLCQIGIATFLFFNNAIFPQMDVTGVSLKQFRNHLNLTFLMPSIFMVQSQKTLSLSSTPWATTLM